MENNSFDRLVSGLSDGERKDMLDKMKAGGNDTESLASDDKFDQEEQIPFAEQIKHESFFYRIYLWIRALLANTSMETIFNEHKVAQIARHIDKVSPHLLDYRRCVLLSSFYDKLSELKLCADFFKPYIQLMEEDENTFLVFLGSLVMNEVEEKMNSEVDPYSIPLSDGPRPEQRMHLLRKMDEVMNSIPQDSRNQMYYVVRSLEWLKQFTKLPFQRFISLFSTVVENNYSCSFSSLENEISSFARILCNGMKIPHEVFEALYLFSRRNTSGKTTESIDDVSNKAADFMDKANSQIAMMRMFITTVPMRSVGRVVYADASWNPGNFTGGEDWYQRYKANWRKLFDQKWEAWSHDCKKEALRTSFTRNFGLETFPLLPERPWASLWGGVPFRYELTAGFLNWFMKEKFPAHEMTLKTLMLEGDFIQKENRAEYNESFNKLIQLSVDFQSMNRRLSAAGEYGMLFNKLRDERIRSLQANSKIESILRSITSDVRSMLSSFGDACRTLEMIFSGIFLEKKDSRYDSLSNLNRIQGKNNEQFKMNLKEARESLLNAFELVRELEPIDTPSLMK